MEEAEAKVRLGQARWLDDVRADRGLSRNLHTERPNKQHNRRMLEAEFLTAGARPQR